MNIQSLKALYPFEGKRLDVRGNSLHYLDEGKGETVLMVHGNPTWSFYFRNVVKALSGEYRCIVPDHVGMGLSARPDDKNYDYTLQSRVDDLDTLMAHVAPSGPVTLILHDWGGMIGMSWAVRHPERIKAIVALNTGCFRLPEEKPFPPGLTVMRGAATGLPLRLSSFFRRMVLRSCTNKVVLDEATMNGYHEPYDGWNESRAVHRFVQDIPLVPSDKAWTVVVDTESKLNSLAHVPMFLPWGMKDWVFDEAFLNGWLKRFPKAQAKRFEDCGHFLLEDARDEVIPLIAGFVKGAAVRA